MSDKSSQQSENPFSGSAHSPNFAGRRSEHSQPGRGYVRQIPILAILTIVQGVLLSIMALFCVGYGVMIVMMPNIMPPEERARMEAEAQGMLAVIGGVAIALGVLILIIAIMHIVAGIRTLKYRGRVFTIVTWSLGLLSAFTCYCGPTSVGLAIWGLIVFLNPAVVSAFQMAETGMSSREIEDQFH